MEVDISSPSIALPNDATISTHENESNFELHCTKTADSQLHR